MNKNIIATLVFKQDLV